jgi:hypothetical protein
MDDLNYQNPKTPDGRVLPMTELEIDISRKRRWIGWTLYILIFAGLAALLVWFFVMLNTTLALAIAVVTFMIGYMVTMGYFASRTHDEGRNSF